MNIRQKTVFFQPIIFSLLIGIIYTIPFLSTKGALYGSDLFFHIDRMRSFSNILSSPINFDTFYNSGQPINIFYPWLTFYPFYLINLITHSIWSAWYIYIAFITSISAYIAYYSYNGIFNDNKSSYVFSLLYIFTSYRLDNIFSRFAAGEVVAFTFLPLIFYGLFLIIKSDYKKWPILTVGMTLTMYTHILSVVMSALVIAIILITSFAFWDNKVKRILAFTYATGATLLLSAFAYIPMLEQLINLKIEKPAILDLNDWAKNISQIINSSLDNSIVDHVPGLVFIISLIILLLIWNKLSDLQKYIVGIGLFCLFLTTNFIPWGFLSKFHLNIIQFPFRFNIYSVLFISAALTSTVKKVNKKYIISLFLILTVLHSGTVLRGIRLKSTSPVIPPRELSVRNSLYNLTHSYYQTDYANELLIKNEEKKSYRQKIWNHEVYENNKLVPSKAKFTAESASFTVNNIKGKIYLPTYYYKGQYVLVNGKPIKSNLSPWGSTQIFSKQLIKNIKISYRYSTIAKLSVIISAISSLLLFSYMFKQKK